MLRSALRHAYGEVPMLTPTSGDVLPHLPSGPAASASHDPTPRASRKRNESSKVRPAHVAVLSLTRGQVNAVRAAFKAGIAPSRIAREFGISQSEVRKVLASDARQRGRES